jgi:hypothetical protein
MAYHVAYLSKLHTIRWLLFAWLTAYYLLQSYQISVLLPAWLTVNAFLPPPRRHALPCLRRGVKLHARDTLSGLVLYVSQLLKPGAASKHISGRIVQLSKGNKKN